MGAQCCKGDHLETGGAGGLAEKRGALVNIKGNEDKNITHSDLDTFNNILILTDSYKVTHHLQYPPGTEVIYSYFECRGGLYKEVCFFGLQYFLKRYLVGEVVNQKKIAEAENYFKQHFSHPIWGYDAKLFNKKGWENICTKHGGRLPVVIKAVPEGTVLPWKNVLFTIENTDQECYWLTNYLETLLVQVWYPTTVATQSREQKKIIMKYLKETGCEDVIQQRGHLFKLHDFGFRGVSSVESAALGGAGHLVNFMGTDTMASLVLVKEFYGESVVGFSIPASEHSTMTAWGPGDGELKAMANILEQYPTGNVACVSDSYDIFNACENYWGKELRDHILQRQGTLVVRPDSGDLPGIVLQVLSRLESKFGSTETKTGHKLLPDCIRVIQGDGIDINTLDGILRAMKNSGWAADNMVFGSGGALLQKLHRDTEKCAFKCSFAKVGGEGMDVSKDPVTDSGKRSKKGKLTLELRDNGYVTFEEGSGDPMNDILREVFRDGVLLIDDDFKTIRDRADGIEDIKSSLPTQIPPQQNIANDPYAGPKDPFGSNIIMLTDSYKVTHHLQYPPGTQRVYSYFESRGGEHAETCFFGLQYFMKKYLVGQVVTAEKIERAEEYFRLHFQGQYGYDEKIFRRVGWEHVLSPNGKREGGHLPIVIKAVPEGTVLPCKNVLFTMENTEDECFWLTNYLESLLVQVWYPMTVCTQSREQKKVIMQYLQETGCGERIQNQNAHIFKLHDFGFRGTSSVESAAIGGAAHLVNFVGSDTMAALLMLKEYYDMPCAGLSIPSAEHSTITCWGRERELEAFRNMLEQFKTGMVSVVSDSYDIFNACDQYWGTDLKEELEKRDGLVVIRPDSGKLPDTVISVLEKLESKFGSTMTNTGHKLLPACIRVLQGDGIDPKTMKEILKDMKDKDWAADNLAFGSGGALLQKLHRDTLKCAFKCSSIKRADSNEYVAIYKDPITDPMKKSKKGRLKLQRNGDNTYVTICEGSKESENQYEEVEDELREVFRDGKLVIDDPFEEIRRRADLYVS